MKKEITTLSILEELLEMKYHNILCYSKNYLMNTPKEGKEQQWADERRAVEIVETLIAEQRKKMEGVTECAVSSLHH